MIIEAFLKNELTDALRDPVYLEIPENPPDKFVAIERTGGSEENTIRTATITVQSYGGTLYEAASLNADVRAAMFDLVNSDDICRVELNSDYNYPDIARKRHRYQAVFEIYYY